MRRSARVLTCTAVAGLATAAPAGAPAAGGGHLLPLQPPRAGALPAHTFAGPVRDRVLSDGGRRSGARAYAARASSGSPYRTRDGYTIRVTVSRAHQLDRSAVQGFVDFLDSRLHGSELGRLSVVIETPRQVGSDCGSSDALACYDPSRERMIVLGEDPGPGQPSLAYVITHEYGHHIAFNRRNTPWSAAARGPKRWDSLEHVCAGVRAHRFFPGDEGDHYYQDPGEAWAEAYASYHYRSNPWRWTPLLRPGPAAFRAIRRDVLGPWRGPVRAARSLSFRLGGGGVRWWNLAPTLDGSAVVRVRPAPDERIETRVFAGRRLVGRSASRSVPITICGARSLRLAFVRQGGYGPVRVSVAYPG